MSSQKITMDAGGIEIEPQEKCVDVPRENCKDRQIAFLEQDLKVQSPE